MRIRSTGFAPALTSGAALGAHSLGSATYQLPPFVCAQTCDQNPACTAYAVDSAQQNCYIGGPSGGGANYTMYFRLPGL